MSCRAAVQAGGFAYLLFLFSQGIDGYFEGQAMPDQYTAHNITVTIRTIVRGLSYLCTFIFAANAVGLSGVAEDAFSPVTTPHISLSVSACSAVIMKSRCALKVSHGMHETPLRARVWAEGRCMPVLPMHHRL